MSSKTVLSILAAALAVAVFGIVSVSSVSDAASPYEDFTVGNEGGEPAQFGPMMSFEQFPQAPPAEFGFTGSPFQPAYGPFEDPGADMYGMPPMGHSPMDGMMCPDARGPPGSVSEDVSVVVIDGGPRSTEDVIEEYEKAYYDRQVSDTEVVVVDNNEYSGELAEIVDAMNKVLGSPVSDCDFLTMVVNVLVSEDKLSSADAVREIQDRRFNEVRFHAEPRNGEQKSKDDDADDDINSDPVYIDESEEDDAPVIFYAPALVETGSVFAESFADPCVRSDNRYCCGVI